MLPKGIFEVEKVLAHRQNRKGKLQFLLKWKGFPSSENTWEKEDNLNCRDLIEEYWQSVATQEVALHPPVTIPKPEEPILDRLDVLGWARAPDGRIVWAIRDDDGETVFYENEFLKRYFPDQLLDWYIEQMVIDTDHPAFNCTILGPK